MVDWGHRGDPPSWRYTGLDYPTDADSYHADEVSSEATMGYGAPPSGERSENPGSRNHPNGCKPCNKYNPHRPDDSCKHAKDCEFCHEQHERPKHRGQRGRHALQRRQYLETKDDLNEDFTALVDDIYQVPHQILDEIKRLLATIPHRHREEKVLLVLDKIKDIGERAQNARPDNSRLRGARIVTSDSVSALSELDGRFKWLVGTLHLMVRKMWDAKEHPDKTKEVVEKILNACRQLPYVVDLHWDPEDAGLQAPCPYVSPPSWVREASKLGAGCKWLEGKLRDLAMKALNAGATQEDITRELRGVQEECDRLPNPLKADRQKRLLGSGSLPALYENVARVLEDVRLELFDDDDDASEGEEVDILEWDQRRQEKSGRAPRPPPVAVAAAPPSCAASFSEPPPQQMRPTAEALLQSAPELCNFADPRIRVLLQAELQALTVEEAAARCAKVAEDFAELARRLQPKVLQ